MSAGKARCPYCETVLERIRLLRPPTPDVFTRGVQTAEWIYATFLAEPDSANVSNSLLGEVRGLICHSCWRLMRPTARVNRPTPGRS